MKLDEIIIKMKVVGDPAVPALQNIDGFVDVIPRRRPDGGKMSSKAILPLDEPYDTAWRATEQLARARFSGMGTLPAGVGGRAKRGTRGDKKLFEEPHSHPPA